MESSPNKTMDSNNATQQIKLNDQASKPNPSSHSEKRPRSEDVDEQIKKIKIEASVPEQKGSAPSTVNTASPTFASAMVEQIVEIVEITDEELLEFTLEFERKHGI